MENYRSGEVVLLNFPFTDAPVAKRRPALVIPDVGRACKSLGQVGTGSMERLSRVG